MTEHMKSESDQARAEIDHNVKRTADAMLAAFWVAIALALVSTAGLILSKV